MDPDLVALETATQRGKNNNTSTPLLQNNLLTRESQQAGHDKWRANIEAKQPPTVNNLKNKDTVIQAQSTNE